MISKKRRKLPKLWSKRCSRWLIKTTTPSRASWSSRSTTSKFCLNLRPPAPKSKGKSSNNGCSNCRECHWWRPTFKWKVAVRLLQTLQSMKLLVWFLKKINRLPRTPMIGNHVSARHSLSALHKEETQKNSNGLRRRICRNCLLTRQSSCLASDLRPIRTCTRSKWLSRTMLKVRSLTLLKGLLLTPRFTRSIPKRKSVLLK